MGCIHIYIYQCTSQQHVEFRYVWCASGSLQMPHGRQASYDELKCIMRGRWLQRGHPGLCALFSFSIKSFAALAGFQRAVSCQHLGGQIPTLQPRTRNTPTQKASLQPHFLIINRLDSNPFTRALPRCHELGFSACEAAWNISLSHTHPLPTALHPHPSPSYRHLVGGEGLYVYRYPVSIAQAFRSSGR